MIQIASRLPFISLVIPVLNEEVNIPILYKGLKRYLVKYQYEIIFINDGSTDESTKKIKQLHSKDSRVKLINLSKNFGHQMAITCGLDFVRGEVAIVMDADLQDPPELIPAMLAKWRMGYDVVYGIRTQRFGESFFKKSTADIFYKTLNFLSPTKVPPNAGDFRLLSKRVVMELRHAREYQRFLRGIVSWMGFRQIGIPYTRSARMQGRSTENFFTSLWWAKTILVNFSFKPLEWISFFAFMVMLGTFLLLGVNILMLLLFHNSPQGIPTIVFLILFLGGVQLLSLSVIAEYLAKIFLEVKHRPRYIVRKTVNLEYKT